MTKLTGRAEVKALDLSAIFEAAVEGQQTVFTHSDADTFTFAKQRARTATQRLVDSKGQRFSGRISVLTEPTLLLLTYAAKGHGATGVARTRRARKEVEASKRTGHTVETQKFEGAAEARQTLVVAQGQGAIYFCTADTRSSIGPALAEGDDVRCAWCRETNESSDKIFNTGAAIREDGEVIDEAKKPTILMYATIEAGVVVPVAHAVKRQSRRRAQKAELGEHISAAAVKARKERKKKERTSLARRRGR